MIGVFKYLKRYFVQDGVDECFASRAADRLFPSFSPEKYLFRF